MTETGPNENPLISNRKLRQIYEALVQARVLDEHLAKLQRGIKPAARLASNFGQEACRTSALIELKAGDLVSDATIHPVTSLILAAKVRPLLQQTIAHLRQKNGRSTTSLNTIAQHLTPVADGRERLRIAMGAALVLKMSKRDNIVVAFVQRREIGSNPWKKVLTIAHKLELPIIFVVLPSAPSKKRASTMLVCDKAGLCGVPGIPVDSADAVAMFRVVQESLGRTRGGDGPVVIECLMCRLPDQTTQRHDPITQMRRFLLQRKVCDQAWLDTVDRTFRRQLRQSKHLPFS